MDRIIDDIKSAQDSGAYYSALALALTIPDVCYKYDKTICSKGGKGYGEWYDKWVTAGLSKEYFNGDHCYALRCAYLHCVDADIEKQKQAFGRTGDIDKDLTFRLRYPDSRGLNISITLDDKEKQTKIIDITCNILISSILIGYRKFIKQQPTMEIVNKNIIF